MKKLVFAVLVMLITSWGFSETATVNGITWTYSVSNGKACISGASNAGARFTVPEILGGYPVTSIGESAFAYCTSLTSVTIPSSVTSIGSSAFHGCSSLTSVTIPEGVTKVGSGAFYNCKELTSVTIPSSVTSIGDYAFEGCSNLPKDENGVQYESAAKVALIDVPTSLIGEFLIPNSVRFIHSSAFDGCSSLTSVTTPSSVTSIGDGAFYGCTSLTSVTIPKGVTTIGYSTFSGCSSLISVTIPEGVTTIGDGAFRGCSALTSVTIPSSVTSIGSNAFDSNTSVEVDGQLTLICSMWPQGLSTSIKASVIIPNGVTSIGSSAFMGCTDLTSVTIPEGVTSIGKSAFMGCTDLTSVTIPSSVTSIGEYAFSGVAPEALTAPWLPSGMVSNNLKTLIISEGVTSIGESAFYDCSSLTSVTIPSSVTSIGDYAFYNCSSLTSVTIPEGVTSIGDCVFEGCSGLTSVMIPSSVTSIGIGVFYGCSSLTSFNVVNGNSNYSAINGLLCSKDGKTLLTCPPGLATVTIPSSVTSIGDYAFESCSSLTSVTIPDGMTSIPGYAFLDCSSLTSVTIPSSVTSIGDGAFYGCTSLTSVTIPEGVTSIGDDAFEDCSSLTSVTIPEGVTSIGDDAFFYCSSLTSVTIPSSVTSIGDGAFYGCTSLTSVTIPEGVISIGDDAFASCSGLPKDENGVQYESAAKVILIDVPTSMTGEFVIPNSVRFIHSRAFSGCSGLTSVRIPEGVTSIGSFAFQYCRRLTSVTIPEGVTSIGDYTFEDCSSLTSVTIPSSVTSIGDYTFEDCSSLTSVTIPDGVTSIGGYAFRGCSGLTSVTIPEGVTSIGGYAFYNCSNLTSVTIPSSVTEIGFDAFYGVAPKTLTAAWLPSSMSASKLKTLVVPEGVTSIGYNAFENCYNLTSVTIPSSVTSIRLFAFSDCDSLTSILFKGNPPTASSSSFPSCDGYYPSTKATEWSKVIQSGLWNNLRMTSYQLVTLSFNANGGTGGGSDEYIVGMSLQAPTVSREGYTFKGWSPSVPSVVPETTTTYTAQWQVNQYRMTFNANGGTGGKTLTQDYGSRLTAPTVSRTGYTFTGWSPSLPATVPAEAKSFVAQWRINQYTQTFDANGGEGGAVVKQDYNSQLSAPTVTRDGFAFLGWEPTVPSKVPAENVTYVAQWEIQAPSWETPDNYQNNMTIYAQVKDTTKDALIESAGSLLAAFDSNGQCRGVASITTGPTGKLYQLTVCSNTAAGEALTLKIWNASTGETIDIGESVAFVSDGKIGSLPAPKVYTVGQIALDVQLKTGWNWFSVNVELPHGTTLSEVFKDWTPCDEDVIKSATSTATYYDGVWYPEDFALEPGKMYQIKNSVTDPVTIRLMGAPVPSTTEIAVKAGWNWLGYTGTSPVDVATAFSADTVFTDEDLLKSGTASATYYGGSWWGDLKLEPGKGYKLQVANATTVKYAGAIPAAAPVALLSVGANPNWVADERQYNMTVYASVKDAAGRAFETAGSWLGAFDTNGICHGAVALGNGPRGKLYQLTPGSDTASGEVFTLKLWDAASGQIYDIEQTITFVSDGTVGSIINPQVYTVVETAVKFDVAANVIGDGIVTGAGAYEAGETVALTATPAEGYVFCGWSTTPVSMEATHSFTMPEEAVTLTAYFAPAAALNNYIAGRGFVSADDVDAKIQAHIAENNLKTPEEVEAAIEAHVASNGLLTPAQANQQTQDYIVANQLKSEQEVAAAIAQAIEEYVSSNGLLTPTEAEQLVKDYIADNKLMSKDEAKQELLDADEVFTADEMKALALGAPVIQVKDGKATVSIQMQQASKLDGEWEVVEDGEVSVEITPKAGEKASFYKFVVPNQQ